jgi:hypothetical protein
LLISDCIPAVSGDTVPSGSYPVRSGFLDTQDLAGPARVSPPGRVYNQSRFFTFLVTSAFSFGIRDPERKNPGMRRGPGSLYKNLSTITPTREVNV